MPGRNVTAAAQLVGGICTVTRVHVSRHVFELASLHRTNYEDQRRRATVSFCHHPKVLSGTVATTGAIKGFLSVFAGVALVACVSAVEPNRETCFFPGDTATLTPVILEDSLIVDCRWGIAERLYCHSVPVQRHTASECVVGTKWVG